MAEVESKITRPSLVMVNKEEDYFGKFVDMITTDIGFDNIYVMVILAISLFILCLITCISMWMCFRNTNS